MEVHDIDRFNQNDSEFNALYHQYAKECGISNTTLWIVWDLYIAQPMNLCTLQKRLGFPMQTIHSCIHSLAKNGFVTIQPAKNSKKSKDIFLSEKGMAWAACYIAPLQKKEIEAFQSLSLQEQELFIRIQEKYLNALKAGFTALKKEKEESGHENCPQRSL